MQLRAATKCKIWPETRTRTNKLKMHTGLSLVFAAIMNSLVVFWYLIIFTSAQNLKFFTNFITECVQKPETFKCLKIQSLKVMDRAVHSKSIPIINGLELVSDRSSRDFTTFLNGTTLEALPTEEIDEMLESTTARFLHSRKLEIKVPKLIEEGRKKGGKGGGWGALMVALGIKGTFLTMAYHGIAVMSGTALIVGKMAILLSAILGLKKLVSSGQEKTTFEIVKVPKHSETHTHSTSYEDDDHYRRRIAFL